MTTKIGVKLIMSITLAVCSFTSNAQLNANFIASPTAGCSPVIVSFTDKSIGNPNFWKWDLGNGTISFLQNPTVTYFNAGQYNIKLLIKNAAGDSNVILKLQFINIYAAPTIAFNANQTTGCFPLPVNFTDNSSAGSGTITQWQWDFGDGNTSNLQNPNHIYTSAGNYNVTLKATNSFGCVKSLSKSQLIKISNGVLSNFTNSVPSSCNVPININFTNTSTGTGVLTYQWDFGDGGTSTLPNPTHTYTSLGNYSVKLITKNTNGCIDTITKINLINLGNINANFTTNIPVCINSSAGFLNTSSPAPISVLWNFGDGSTSTTINPIKSYNTSGNYNVKMVANFGGCVDSVIKNIVVLNKPTAKFNSADTVSCKAPFTAFFNNTSINAIAYNWDFGDGNFSNVQNPSHVFTAEGEYTITLIVTNANGCIDTLTKTNFIKIKKPHVTINNLFQVSCAPLIWTFTSTINSVEPVATYFWDFGDGTTSTQATPTHTFAAGSYSIKLIITTINGCTDTAIVNPGIIALEKPVANFEATPREACAQYSIHFKDFSTGNITNWNWFFGDGGMSTESNPVYNYGDTGYFNVTLVVCNNVCCDTIKFLNYIHIKPPIAIFATGYTCAKPLERQFFNSSIGADEWLWDFGDGDTTSIKNPLHTFNSVGKKIVTLKVKNYSTGCEHIRKDTIKLMIEKANFVASDTVICKKNAVVFKTIGINSENIALYYWDFGDGTSSTNASDTHTYNNAGKYDVKLIIMDSLGCVDSLVKPMYIKVNGPTANFEPSVPGSCLLSTINFIDSSTNDGSHSIKNWIWNYGDGKIDTLSNGPFIHNYSTAGSYTVSLSILDVIGCIDNITKPNVLFVSKPVANFYTLDTVSCPNKPINFTNNSTGPSLIHFWDFGDGTTSNLVNPVHTYSGDGLYNVKLNIVDQYGCKDSMTSSTEIKIVYPIANFVMSDSMSTCPPLFVNFSNFSLNYNNATWDFGDGTSSQIENPSHFYTHPGTYFAKLTTTTNGGCIDILQKKIIVKGPEGSFNYGPIIGCNPLTATFTASSKNNTSFVWDFNDGTTISSTDSIITHSFTTPGIYLPKLILVDIGGCTVPITGIDTVIVNGVKANFDFSNPTFCDSASINFINTSVSNDVITNYNWNFGDGNISSVQNPTHSYNTTGLYYPKLIVSTQTGCIDSIKNIAPIKIVNSPKIDIDNSPNGCAPLTVNFMGKIVIPDTAALSWKWNFDNGDSSSLQNPTAQNYNIAGIYTIKLTSTNSSGCITTKTKTIESYNIPLVNAGQDTFVCKGKFVTLNATGANNYIWSPNTKLSCTNCNSTLANPDSTITYFVKGTTINGCSNFDTITLNVKQPFTMLSSKADTLCIGSVKRLFASGAFTYKWSPTSGLNNANASTVIASPNISTTYSVIGFDEKGCFSDTNYIPIKVYNTPTVDAGVDKTINVGQTASLTSTVSNDVTSIIWSPNQLIIEKNPPNIIVKPKETTDFTVEVKNAGGCKAIDHVTIFVLCNGSNVFIPNTFSPNGDGQNDIFYPRGTGLFNIKSFKIFNRWGEIVFEKNGFAANDESSGWNGKVNGKALTPDVFVYTMELICENNAILTYKGNVALIQ